MGLMGVFFSNANFYVISFSVGQRHAVKELQADGYPTNRLYLGSQPAQGTERVRYIILILKGKKA